MHGNELYHHGILGMRWGVRRTPKELGRTRKNIDNMKSINDGVKSLASALPKRSSKKTKQALSKMTDQELRERVNRLNLEQQYTKLTGEQTSKGRVYVDRTLDVIGSTLTIASATVGLVIGVKKLKG